VARASRTSAPKGNKRQRTRAALLEAAAELITEKGYDRLSLEQVAARAGMTRGAVYGNFKNRDDLMREVVQARWKPVKPALKSGASLREQLRIIGEAVAAGAHTRPRAAVRMLSLQLHALTHDEARARVAEENADFYRQTEQWLLRYVSPSELPMPPDQFVRVLHALSNGLLAQRGLTPGLINDQVIVGAFEALAPR